VTLLIYFFLLTVELVFVHEDHSVSDIQLTLYLYKYQWHEAWIPLKNL